MTISYLNSYDNAVKSRLTFDKLSIKWKRFLVYRSIAISILVLLFLLDRNYLSNEGIRINGVFQPFASLIFNLIWSVPVSILIGWVLYKFSLVSHNNAIIAQFEGLPAEYFGSVSLSLEDDGLAVDGPTFRGKYSWKMINALKTTGDYLFFCFGSHLISSIPTSALGNQQSEFIAKAENLITGSK